MVVDDEEKANILNTFFSTVFTVENEMLGEIPRNNENPILRVTNLTQEEVRNRLNKIKIDKSPGPDGIHPRVLRELSNVNLLRQIRVSGIITQGASRMGKAEYVKEFKVAYSVDGHEFTFYKVDGQKKDKIFHGNLDNEGRKANILSPPVTAQYIRVYPVTCHRGCTLRFELFGCEMSGCSDPLGMKTHMVPDKQITASSVFKTWGIDAFTWHPHYARLDKIGKTNAWTASENNQSQWLQIDLGVNKKITGVITQGAKDFGNIQYVEAYKIAYSDTGSTWLVYQDSRTKTDKVFLGNTDNYSHKRNLFSPPFSARYVRILPQSWHERITLRMELLGCDN
ncbi:unnamed protein product [Ranitomeya imitator]|uniref:F5/8 type C domain-containing protein n=1 Tax=Ranitomeya imitator TaxID=111125 RepID=A0ABN9KYQ2_9NEOB|nr:unnamed protein product [Ranitomeya imitator]